MNADLFRIVANKYGQSVSYFESEEDTGTQFGAFIQPIIYKNRQYLSHKPTPLGRSDPGRYMYYGPAEVIPEERDGFFVMGGTAYSVCQWEKVMFGDQVSHIQAVLKVREEDAHLGS